MGILKKSIHISDFPDSELGHLASEVSSSGLSIVVADVEVSGDRRASWLDDILGFKRIVYYETDILSFKRHCHKVPCIWRNGQSVGDFSNSIEEGRSQSQKRIALSVLKRDIISARRRALMLEEISCGINQVKPHPHLIGALGRRIIIK